MTQHVDINAVIAAPVEARRQRGARAYHSGVAAEDIALRTYLAAGLSLRAARWRGASGEIDMILDDCGVAVFAEVKKAQTHDAARQSLRPAQMARIHAAAAEYVARLPGGQLTEMRFDLVTVDATGHCDVMKGALSHF